jgi:DNA-binding response OmpR family regulator
MPADVSPFASPSAEWRSACTCETNSFPPASHSRREVITMAARILSVAYDLSLLATRQWILEHEGFVVTRAVSLEQAIAFCENRSFDLVVLGHSMPDSDKRSLLAALRSACSTPVIALLCPGEERVPGADYYLDVLAGPPALVAMVYKVLSKAKVA